MVLDSHFKEDHLVQLKEADTLHVLTKNCWTHISGSDCGFGQTQ